MKNRELILLFLTFPTALLLFFPSLNYFFFQDDWFVLNWVQTGDILSFFNFRTDIIYWRPLAMPILFFSLFKIFSLNVQAFHAFVFIIYCFLILSLYSLLLHLDFDKRMSALGAFLYGTWPIHYISLSWLSTTSYIIGPLFQILSFIFFIKFVKEQKLKTYFICFAFFLLAVLSSEFSLVLPAIFFIYLYFYKKKINLIYFQPFILIGILNLFTRFILFPVPATGDYQLLLDTKLIKNYLWYILWGFNFPENFKTLIFPSLPKESLKILLDFWHVALPAILLLIFSIIQIASRFNQERKVCFLGLIWLTAGLLPVIFLTYHSYPLYLAFAGIGLILILTNSFKRAPDYLILGFILIWLTSSFSSLNFTKNNHWISNEQAVSKAYINYVQTYYKDPPANSVFIFKPPDITFSRNNGIVIVKGENTIKLSLSDQHAMEVIFPGKNIKSIFSTHQEKVNLPEGLSSFEISPSQ